MHLPPPNDVYVAVEGSAVTNDSGGGTESDRVGVRYKMDDLSVSLFMVSTVKTRSIRLRGGMMGMPNNIQPGGAGYTAHLGMMRENQIYSKVFQSLMGYQSNSPNKLGERNSKKV